MELTSNLPDERPSLALVTPILAGLNRQVDGLVAAIVDLDQMSEIVRRAPVDPDGRAFVLNGAGRVILHRNASLVQSRADYSGLDQTLLGPGAVRYRSGLELRIAGVAPVPTLGRRVFVEHPEAVVLAPSERVWNLALAGLRISLVLAVAAALVLARTLTKPRGMLAMAAPALGADRPSRCNYQHLKKT